MSSEHNITPEVQRHIDAVNETRVKDDSMLKYPRTFWGGYKQHVRELITGSFVGAGVGALLGLALLPFFGAPAIILASAAAGLVFGAEKLSAIGTTSGTHAANLAEKHARILDPDNKGDPLKAVDEKLMDSKNGHDYEFDQGKKEFFHIKSGLAGATIGAACGALIAAFGESLPLVAGITASIGLGGMPILAGALILGVLGLTYGIDRSAFKSIFNKIDSFFSGRHHDTSDRGREQAREEGFSDGQLLHKRLQRQDDIHALQDKYDKEIFRGGLKGFFQGLFGGSVMGALIGGGIGLIALGVLALASPAFATFGVVAACAVGGIAYFSNTFSEVGYNAGAESVTRALDDEVVRTQAKENYIASAQSTAPKGLFGSVFDSAMNSIRHVSTASKKLYENVYSGNSNDHLGSSEIMPTEPSRKNYSVTSEEAKKLDEKLNMGNTNFGQTYASQQQMKQTLPANMTLQ